MIPIEPESFGSREGLMEKVRVAINSALPLENQEPALTTTDQKGARRNDGDNLRSSRSAGRTRRLSLHGWHVRHLPLRAMIIGKIFLEAALASPAIC